MSITTGYTKLGAYLLDLVAPAHAAGLRLFRQNSLSVVVAGSPLAGGAGPRPDIISLTQLPLFIGIIAGAFLTALALKEFRIYGMPPKRQLASALAGGLLMGMGARMASGCNLTFVLGALPVFAFQGFLFVAAMTLGAWAGARRPFAASRREAKRCGTSRIVSSSAARRTCSGSARRSRPSSQRQSNTM